MHACLYLSLVGVVYVCVHGTVESAARRRHFRVCDTKREVTVVFVVGLHVFNVLVGVDFMTFQKCHWTAQYKQKEEKNS